MSGSAPGNRQSPRHSDVYWRRRVFALAAGIGALALIAWTLNGTLGGAGNARQAADTTHTGHHAMAAAAATSPAPSPGAGTPTAAATATPRPTAPGSTRHGADKPGTGKHGRGQHGRHGAVPKRGAACPPGSVVLSLFTPKYHYPGHEVPRFELDVVSTAARPCAYDLGAKHVHLVIKAGGERRVWDSADCVRSAAHRMDRLTRGVPAVLRISWDRKASAAGCRLPGRAAQPGTYTATARSGPLHSQPLIFVLGGSRVAVP